MRKIIFLTALSFLFVSSPLCAQPSEISPAKLPELVGAHRVAKNKIMIHIPAASPAGDRINQFLWVNRGMALLTSISGHAMACPPSMFWEKISDVEPSYEGSTITVYAFITDEMLNQNNIEAVKIFMRDMAKKNSLKSVFFEYNGALYKLDAK